MTTMLFLRISRSSALSSSVHRQGASASALLAYSSFRRTTFSADLRISSPESFPSSTACKTARALSSWRAAVWHTSTMSTPAAMADTTPFTVP